MSLSPAALFRSVPGNRAGTGLVLAVITIILDQISKWLIMDMVLKAPRLIEITGFFNIVWVENRGVSFGTFNDGTVPPWGLMVLSLVIAVILTLWLRRTDSLLLGSALGMVIGGAIGNVIDRARFGFVFDFLDFHVAGWHWPAFNVADSAIVIGVGLMFLDSLLSDRERGPR